MYFLPPLFEVCNACLPFLSLRYPWEDRHPSEGTNPLQGPNLWPTTEAVSHEWRPAMINFFMQMVSG